MMKNLTWLPATKVCRCSDSAVNCLPKHKWYKNQVPIWNFTKRELKCEFERYSKQVHPAVFPRVLAHRIIETFSHKGEVVLDVFSGVGTTMVAAAELERHSIGLELNASYVNLAKRRLAYIREMAVANVKKNDNNEREFFLIPHTLSIKADARDLIKIVPRNSIDLVITSPPYWDMLKQTQSKRNIKRGKYLKKNYSNDHRDLSNLPNLENFLKEMGEVFYQIQYVLKPVGRFVLITGDYRRRGQYIPLHSLYIKQLAQIGFDLNNVIIWDRSSEYDVGLYSYPYHFIAANGMIEYVLEFIKK